MVTVIFVLGFIVIAILVWNKKTTTNANQTQSQYIGIKEDAYTPKQKPPFDIDLSQFSSLQRVAICPTCLGTLPKLPQRKQKCKLCGEQIIVANIPVTDERVFLNSEDGIRLKSEIEKYWRKLSEKEEIAKKYYWWSEDEYHLNRQLFYNKFKRANETDFYFASAEQQIQKLLGKKDFYAAKMLSLDLMNKRLDDEEDSGYYYDSDDEDAERLCKPSSAYPHACNVIKFDLLDNKKLKLDLAAEFCTDIDGCERTNLNGTKMDIDELLKLNPMPIPCKICTANRMYRCCIIIGNRE